MIKPIKKLSLIEFVSLMALLMSLAALAIDAMLPALPLMGRQLGVENSNDTQWIISSLFLGMSVGQIFYGPLSDSFGRKRVVYVGIILFIFGCFVSLFATTFPVMIVGRLLQGLGVASTRIVSIAIVRDQYSGREMAQIMSLITMVFILVPALAPSIGQLILLITHWKKIFHLFIILSALGLIWFWRRQPETLEIENRIPLSIRQIMKSIKRILKTRVTIGYTICSGLIFGAFVGYLLSSQQIFIEIYKVGELFPLYFAALAIAIGCSSFINSKLVKNHGMIKLSLIALTCLSTFSILFLSYYFISDTHPGLKTFMLYLILSFSCIGILFGNLNTLAIEPLGDIAGIGTAVISTLQNLISLSLAIFIGAKFNGTVLPLSLGFSFLGIFSIIVFCWTERIGIFRAKSQKSI